MIAQLLKRLVPTNVSVKDPICQVQFKPNITLTLNSYPALIDGASTLEEASAPLLNKIVCDSPLLKVVGKISELRHIPTTVLNLIIQYTGHKFVCHVCILWS